jgi:hypothetical protein
VRSLKMGGRGGRGVIEVFGIKTNDFFATVNSE